MRCENCGRQNDADALYCQKCGKLLEPEDETRVASRSPEAVVSPSDGTIFSIGPTLKFVKAGYALTVVAAVFIVAMVSAFTALPVWAAVLAALLSLLVPAFFHLKQKLVRYRLTTSTIEVDSGFISRSTRNIPLGRIQDVTVSSSITQRLLGFGDVVIDNASEDGGKVVIRNIDSPRKYADIVMRQMRRSGEL
jgi:uncharacterized membrane protein YdbT with pleckstrin-like domain